MRQDSANREIRLVTSVDCESWTCLPGSCGVCCRIGAEQQWCEHYDGVIGGCSRYDGRPALCRLFPFILTFNREAVYLSPTFACPYLLPGGEGEPIDINDFLRNNDIEEIVAEWKPVIDDIVKRYVWKRRIAIGGSRVFQPTAADIERFVANEAKEYIADLPGGYSEFINRCEDNYAGISNGRKANVLPWDTFAAARDVLSPSFSYISTWGLPGGPDGPVHVNISIANDEIICRSAGYDISFPLTDLEAPFKVEDDAREMYGRYIELLFRRHTEVTMAARAMAKVGGDIVVPMPALYMKNILILLRYSHLFLLVWGRLTGGEVDIAAMREVLGMADTFTGIAVGFRGVSKTMGTSPRRG